MLVQFHEAGRRDSAEFMLFNIESLGPYYVPLLTTFSLFIGFPRSPWKVTPLFI